MNDCLFEIKLKGKRKKTQVYGLCERGLKGIYFLVYDKENRCFVWSDVENFEPIPRYATVGDEDNKNTKKK